MLSLCDSTRVPFHCVLFASTTASPVRRPMLCSRFASSELETTCSEMKEEGNIWLNSAGVEAQAHFDADQNIFLQLRGEKRFTLWDASLAGKMCHYPFSHPAQRQSLADFGDGIGVPCPSLMASQNYTVTVSAGDVLIIPPFWLHRVEALSPSISYAPRFFSRPTHAIRFILCPTPVG